MTQTLKEVFYFATHNLVKLLSYVLVVSALFLMLIELLLPLLVVERNQQSLLQFVQSLNLIVGPLITGGFIVLMYDIANAKPVGIFKSLYIALIKWPWLFIANILTSVLIQGGLFLFIIPGIWIYSRLFLTPFIIVIKGESPFKALLSSYEYTKNYSLTILADIGLLVLFFIPLVFILSLLHLLYPIVIVLLIFMMQCLLYVIFYRHYEILIKKS